MRLTLLVPIFAAVASVVAGGGGHNPHPSPKPCQPTPQCPSYDKKGNALVKSSIERIGLKEYRVCEFKHKSGGHRREAVPSPVADPEEDMNELWARGDDEGFLKARDLKALEEWAKRGGGDHYETEECYYLVSDGKLKFGDTKYCTNQLQFGGCPSPRRRSAEEMAQALVVRDYYAKRARRFSQH